LQKPRRQAIPYLLSNIDDHCLMTATVQIVVHQRNIFITLDTAMVIQEMNLSTKSSARYVAFKLRQSVLSGSPGSSALIVDVHLKDSNNIETLMYISARIRNVHTDIISI